MICHWCCSSLTERTVHPTPASAHICSSGTSQKQLCLFCKFAGVCFTPSNDRVQESLGARLAFCAVCVVKNRALPAGLQACCQGVPWWSFKMTGRLSRPVLAPVLAFFARSWTTTAKACRLASQPCQPPEVDEPACHACRWLPVCLCDLHLPTYWSLREAAALTAMLQLKRWVSLPVMLALGPPLP